MKNDIEVLNLPMKLKRYLSHVQHLTRSQPTYEEETSPGTKINRSKYCSQPSMIIETTKKLLKPLQFQPTYEVKLSSITLFVICFLAPLSPRGIETCDREHAKNDIEVLSLPMRN